jgi:hypothetical protein
MQDSRYPGDLNFQRASGFSKAYQGLSEKLETDICKDAADSFQLRIQNVLHLGILPIEITYWSSFLGKIDGYVIGRNSLKFKTETKEDINLTLQVQQTIRENLLQPNDAWVHGHTLLAQIMEPLIRDPSDDPLVGSYIAEGLRSVLGAIVVNSWMCLETLVEDLWISSVNAFPEQLALPVIESNLNRTQDTKPKSISTLVFRKYGFDLHNCMGHILVNERKIDFRTIAGARLAYKQSFSEKILALEDNQNLVSFEAVRNIIAHKGGTADELFIKLTKNDSRFTNITIGAPVLITGEVARDYANFCVECCVKLLEEVDTYLQEIQK